MFSEAALPARRGRVRAPALLLALLLPCAAARAQPPDLLDIYRLALANDPAYQAAAASNQATQEARPQARALLLPDVELSFSASGVRQDVSRAGLFGAAGKRHFHSEDMSLTLTQPVFRMERIIALGQADTRVRQADSLFAFALQDLIVRVAERYFGVLRAVDDVEFARAQKEAINQQLQQAQQRFDVGLIAITDVEEARAGYDLAVADEIQAGNALDNAREALREITGEYHDRLAALGGEVPLVAPEPNDIDEWTQTALEQNLQLEAARLATDVSRAEIRRVEAGHLPSVDLVARANKSFSGGGLSGATDTDTASLGVELNVPLFQGGLVMSRTQEARHLHSQSVDEQEQQRRSTQRQARDAFRGVISGISRVRALRQAVVSNRSALDASEAGFQVGTRTSVDVLNATRDLLRAKRDFAAARYDYVLDLLNLKQAAGTLSEDDLARVNSWLE